jgi:hypothetical protein
VYAITPTLSVDGLQASAIDDEPDAATDGAGADGAWRSIRRYELGYTAEAAAPAKRRRTTAASAAVAVPTRRVVV